MDSLHVFLLIMKFCIVLVALIFILCFGVSILKEHKICQEVAQEMDNCTLKLTEFGVDFQKWEESNFSGQDPLQVADLKERCESVPKCFSAGIKPKTNCRDYGNLTENMPFWCRRIAFFSGDFAKCAGKISQLSGSSQCSALFFRSEYIQKNCRDKCEVIKYQEKCMLEKVTATCATAMASNLRAHLESEKSLLGC